MNFVFAIISEKLIEDPLYKFDSLGFFEPFSHRFLGIIEINKSLKVITKLIFKILDMIFLHLLLSLNPKLVEDFFIIDLVIREGPWPSSEIFAILFSVLSYLEIYLCPCVIAELFELALVVKAWLFILVHFWPSNIIMFNIFEQIISFYLIIEVSLVIF